jgi:OFA family oxalate/formate antiporter-like MFS transporter
MLASTILGSTGNYTTALYVINVALVVGLVCVGLLRWNISTVEESKGDVAATASD